MDRAFAKRPSKHEEIKYRPEKKVRREQGPWNPLRLVPDIEFSSNLTWMINNPYFCVISFGETDRKKYNDDNIEGE